MSTRRQTDARFAYAPHPLNRPDTLNGRQWLNLGWQYASLRARLVVSAVPCLLWVATVWFGAAGAIQGELVATAVLRIGALSTLVAVGMGVMYLWEVGEDSWDAGMEAWASREDAPEE